MNANIMKTFNDPKGISGYFFAMERLRDFFRPNLTLNLRSYGTFVLVFV